MEKRLRNRIRFGSSDMGLHGKLISLKDEMNNLGESVQRLNCSVYPLIVTLSHSPSTLSLPLEYTGNDTEFILSWAMEIDGVPFAPSQIESVTIEYDGKSIAVPVDNNYSGICRIVVCNDTTVKITVVAQGREATAETKINYAYRWFSGVVQPDFEITEQNVRSLEYQGVGDGAARSVSYSAYSNSKVVYAYAKRYGMLSEAVGPLNNNYLSLFGRYDIEINGIDYYLYIYNNMGSVDGGLTYKFR